MNHRRLHHGVLVCAACVTASVAIIGPATAAPTMSITAAFSIDDYDEQHPGYESDATYTVFNTSAPGDINNMVAFTLPAGAAEGVFDASFPTGWLMSIELHQTVFYGNGHVIPPGSFRVFDLFSTLTHVVQGEATAIGRGPPLGLQFNPVLVPVPGYHRLDRDEDADIDGDDLGAWVSCVSGPSVALSGDCGWADLDGDNDVDQSDFGLFQRCLTGHGHGYVEGCETP